jgi:glucose/arabinose dehydrogenase
MRISCAGVVAALLCIAIAEAQPTGFEDREVLDGGALGGGMVVDFAWTPPESGGQLIVIKKEGEIQVYDDPAGDNSYSAKSVALDLSPVLCANSERGVEGIEVHPEFATNRFIFVYYTFNKNGNCDEDPFNGPVNRLSRFVLPESNVIDINTETVFFETPSLEYDHHNSGDIAVGKDGHLWVTVGDGGSTFTGVASDPGNILGSIIRITLEGDIPSDNPYTFESGESNSVRCNETGVPPVGSPEGAKCQEIFAIGMRNPFRFAMDPNTEDGKVRFYVNDVGQAKWEETSEGGTDFAGTHYGWPAREGPCPNSKVNDCADQHPYQDPVHFYIHNSEAGGGACTGGAFVPNGIWPHEYDGAYLFGEYVFGHIYILRDTGEPPCITCDPPVSNMDVEVFTDYDRVLTVKFGPYGDTQALYYSGVPGAIRRVTYVGDGNRSPEAVILADPISGPVGVTVQFSGAGSADPDGDGLSFEWDFNGDGVVDSTVADTSYTYPVAGLYVATLTVSDGNGGTTTSKVEISVGNKPVPVITRPVEGATFAVGDVITLVGSATDVESSGNLPDTALTWEVRQHHDTHFHPFLDETNGNNIVLSPAPEPEDYFAASNSYLEIILTATDSDGLSSTVTRLVQPKIVYVDFDTNPSGLEIFLDGSRFTTPGTATTWENHPLRVEAPDQFNDGQAYVWSSWSTGGGQAHTITIPAASATNPKYVAEFTQFTGTFAPTMAPTQLYRCVPGFLGIVAKETPLLNEETFVNEEYGVYIVQQDDGNLVVRRGTPDNPGEEIWSHGETGGASSYYTRLNGDSNLITSGGSPDNEGDQLWKSNTVNPEGDYFLGISCDSTVVSIYAGRWNNPGVSVWNSAPTPAPTSAPSKAPTTNPPTAAPVALPTESAPQPSAPTDISPGDMPQPEASSTSESKLLSTLVGLMLPVVLLPVLL